MSIEVRISDGLGMGRVARVGNNQALNVSLSEPDLPPVGTENKQRFMAGVLGSNGLDEGTINMNVDGSITPQEFFIGASDEFDIRITDVSILIAGGGVVAHNKFGGLMKLTVGWDLVVTESGNETNIITKALTGGQVIAQAGFGKAYGDGITSFQLTKWTDNDDATTVNMSISQYLPGGLRIGRGTFDRMTSVVNDDLSGLAEFTVRVFGYKHFP